MCYTFRLGRKTEAAKGSGGGGIRSESGEDGMTWRGRGIELQKKVCVREREIEAKKKKLISNISCPSNTRPMLPCCTSLCW